MIRAWHFVGDRLRNGRHVPKDGVWLKHRKPLVLCKSGLHASVHPFDALQYAPGPILCQVECQGETLHINDKLVCRSRRIVQRMDVTEMLRCFAQMRVLSVIHLQPTRSFSTLLNYPMTEDSSIRKAAAGISVDDNITWNITKNTPWDAARDIALAATWTAAREDSAWTAAWTAAKNDFMILVHECFGIKPEKT